MPIVPKKRPDKWEKIEVIISYHGEQGRRSFQKIFKKDQEG